MAQEHDTFLEALDVGSVVTTAFLQEISGDDETVFEDFLRASDDRSEAALYDVPRLRAAVEQDRDLLRGLADEARSITADQDPKLKALSDALAEIAQQAEGEAIDSADEGQKRKVLVFSFFEDTVEWIRDFLRREVAGRPELAGYRDRMVAVSGSGDLDEPSRQRAVQGFAPVSMQAPAGQDADLYDLMIATDVLAEGVNLQQGRHIINFDLPWNPMRLVQRHGRIDRIGSPHSQVFLRTIFPADRLDCLLNLEQRILGKLEGCVTLRARGQRGGSAGAAQTGEEYRQTLRKALDVNRERITGTPWKVGSGMVKGRHRGVFFCAVVGAETEFERTYLRFIPAGEDWAPATGSGMERELGTCLRLIECGEETPPWYPRFLRERAYDFWEVAQHDIWTGWMRETDPANLQPPVHPLNHRVAEFIRSHPPLNVSEDRVNRALDILESPWPRRDEIMLRNWFGSRESQGSGLAGFLIDQILETGLEATMPPPPLPPIEQEEVELLCWMGIEREDGAEELQ